MYFTVTVNRELLITIMHARAAPGPLVSR